MRSTADKYWFIMNHPEFVNKNHISPKIEIEPHNVCPTTNRIESYQYLNTKVQYWIEFMTPYLEEDTNRHELCHNWKFDCGGDTIEEAIDALYQQILKEHGDYTDEELQAKEAEVYNYVKGYVSSLFDKIHEENYSFNDDIIVDDQDDSMFLNRYHTVQYLQDKLVEYKNTLKALTVYKENANMSEIVESDIQNVEHDIWVLEECLKMKLDIDL